MIFSLSISMAHGHKKLIPIQKLHQLRSNLSIFAMENITSIRLNIFRKNKWKINFIITVSKSVPSFF